MTLPAHHNPFRVDRLHALRFRFPPGDSMDGLLERLARQGGRGAIVGPHGSGKSTLFGELVGRLAADGYEIRHARVGRGRRDWSPAARERLTHGVGERCAVLLDGGCHLGPLAFARLRRSLARAAILLSTAHPPLHRLTVPGLPVVLRTTTTPALLAGLCGELEVPLATAEAAALWRSHRGDLRAALRGLYDRAADGP